jgi:hypothetical protein
MKTCADGDDIPVVVIRNERNELTEPIVAIAAARPVSWILNVKQGALRNLAPRAKHPQV